MKYMLLIHQVDAPTPRSPGEWATLSEDEQKAVYADYQAINETPGVNPGHQLDSPEMATTVRVQDGKTLTTDGPFVEIKEAVGGYASSRPTTSTLRSSWPRGSRPPAWAARSRCARWWSGSEPRAGLPRPVGLRPRRPDRLPRRLRPRRGGRGGSLFSGRLVKELRPPSAAELPADGPTLVPPPLRANPAPRGPSSCVVSKGLGRSRGEGEVPLRSSNRALTRTGGIPLTLPATLYRYRYT